MTSINKTSRLFLSFLLGGAIGGAIALMFAPKSGRQLRNDLSRKTNELIEDGKKKGYQSWNGAKDKFESTFDNANEFLNSGMEKITRKTEKVKDAIKSGINAYSEERKSGNIESISDAEKVSNIH
jgi:gas vesicle protein